MPVELSGGTLKILDFNVEFEAESEMSGEFDKFTEVSAQAYPYYGGEYEITPSVEQQVLETKDTVMLDDVTVNAVPYYETSNINGTTVYIASEV